MRKTSRFKRALAGLLAFGRGEGGNVAVIFGIVIIPIMAAAGAAVDYSHANSVRTALQSALDSTALMLARDAAAKDDGQLDVAAKNYFNALFTRGEGKLVTINANYDASGAPSLTVNASVIMDTAFMRIFGTPTMTIGSTSIVKWGNTKLRVALVLDNTGSMSSSNKMTSMKTAAKELLAQLQAAATSKEDVYVSIIPFSKDVSMGKTNYGQSWLRWDLWEEENGSCNKDKYDKKTSCLSGNGKWTPASRSTWNGCITDRDQNFDTTNTAPNTNAIATLFPAEQYASCPVPMMGLSNNWTSLKAKIDEMQPNGNTNQAIGLQWGFQSLTAEPFTIPPKDSNFKYKDIIILLTDGLNTEDRWYTNQQSIDARQTITCANVKAAGITIYAIQVNTNGDPTSALLQSCASSSDKFFILTSANQILTTFNTIGSELTKLRVAQ